MSNVEIAELLNVDKKVIDEVKKLKKGSNPVFCTVNMSSDMADRILLANNIGNRNLKKGNIKKYVRAMKNNDWHLDGTAIQFDMDGILIDGQNRLFALFESGTTQKFCVAFGIEQFADMNTGSPRTLNDNAVMKNGLSDSMVELKGINNACFNRITGAIKSAVVIGDVTVGSEKIKSLRNSEAISILNKYKDIILDMYNTGLFSYISNITYSSIYASYLLAALNGVPCDVIMQVHNGLQGIYDDADAKTFSNLARKLSANSKVPSSDKKKLNNRKIANLIQHAINVKYNNYKNNTSVPYKRSNDKTAYYTYPTLLNDILTA